MLAQGERIAPADGAFPRRCLTEMGLMQRLCILQVWKYSNTILKYKHFSFPADLRMLMLLAFFKAGQILNNKHLSSSTSWVRRERMCAPQRPQTIDYSPKSGRGQMATFVSLLFTGLLDELARGEDFCQWAAQR